MLYIVYSLLTSYKMYAVRHVMYELRFCEIYDD